MRSEVLTRWRWRMRGAWMWPSFVGLTALEALLLHVNPLAGDRTDLVQGALLAGFANLLAIAVGAPVAGHLLRRRRRDLPHEIARDYAGTALLVALLAVFAGVGLAQRSDRLQRERERALAVAGVQRYVASRGDAAQRAHAAYADARRLGPHLYRACVPGARFERWLCVYVDTAQSPPGLTLDRSSESNAELFPLDRR
jgi:hypothetical protein